MNTLSVALSNENFNRKSLFSALQNFIRIIPDEHLFFLAKIITSLEYTKTRSVMVDLITNELEQREVI
jgi:hypothetical protein